MEVRTNVGKCGAAAGGESAGARKSASTTNNAPDGQQQCNATANEDDLGAISFTKRDESKFYHSFYSYFIYSIRSAIFQLQTNFQYLFIFIHVCCDKQ